MRLVVDSNIFISSLDPKDIFHSECYPIVADERQGDKAASASRDSSG
jgi:hypothetical protein